MTSMRRWQGKVLQDTNLEGALDEGLNVKIFFFQLQFTFNRVEFGGLKGIFPILVYTCL